MAIRSTVTPCSSVLAVALVPPSSSAAIPIIYGSEFADSTAWVSSSSRGLRTWRVWGDNSKRHRPGTAGVQLYTALICTPITVLAYVLLIPPPERLGRQ